jgi:molecular chaperone DnaK
VALGAALFAKSSAKIQEVCNASYGTLAMIYNATTGEEKVANSVVIPKNTPIPCSNSQVYQTSEDNEQVIEVDITQGEDEDPRFVDVIGRLTLEVPPNRPKGCEVEVTFSYDENQRVQARVLDKTSGRSREVAVTYRGAGVLSEEELKRRSHHLRAMRIE